MAKQQDWNQKLTSPWNRVWRHPHGYLEGCVITPHGIVAVYSQGGENEVPSTNLTFVYEGRVYSRTIPKSYTQRGLVTVANRYAQEVIEWHP